MLKAAGRLLFLLNPLTKAKGVKEKIMFRKMFTSFTVLLLGILMLAQAPAAVAASHDAREDVSGPEAVLTVGKILKASQAGAFPQGITDFDFEIERLRAWDNANVSTALSGKAIPKEEMPMPEPETAAHKSVTVSGDKAAVRIGDFSAASSADTDLEKIRTAPVTIRFSKAGYYVYRVKETGSLPAAVPGVHYDDHEYFMVIYVCNKTDQAGNTVDGVYVHNITSYRNQSGKEDYQPDLSDIAQVTDNQGSAAGENNETNLSKVGTSTPEHPDRLEAYRFWNDVITGDIILSKNVTGSLGDRTKKFEFQITLKGLDKDSSYSVTGTPQGGSASSESVIIESASKGTVLEAGKAFRPDSSGEAELLVKLRDDEKIILKGIPEGALYKIREAASDHLASYELSSDNRETEAGKAPVMVKTSNRNEAKETALSTEEETMDQTDGTVTVSFTNDRGIAVVTGVNMMSLPFGIAGAILLLMMILLFFRKEDEEEI